jgi:uncharacterized Ntn-hydrolase superfamily protein
VESSRTIAGVTYSIVARDPESGDLGVGVQTGAFGVGRGVPWARAGVGAVATQAFTERSFGPLGLDLLDAGRTPDQALAALVASDADADVRQLGIVDAEGRTAVHTGARCIPHAGSADGDGFTAQGNMLASPDVWPAMAEAYATAPESTLARRLLAALDAAEAAGGDFRGPQSAALLVVPADPGAPPWKFVSNLRVEDSRTPLVELRRLLDLEEAYNRLSEATPETIEAEAERAREAGVPEHDRHWFAVAAAWSAGDLELARSRARPLVDREGWAAAVDRLLSMPPPEE